jgi:hypothetical protein
MGATHAFGPLSETVEERLVRRLAAGIGMPAGG